MAEKAPQSNLRLVALDNADKLIVGPSASRRALIFYPCGATYYSVSTQVLPSQNQAVLVNTSSGPVEFFRDRHGTVVTQEWHGFANGAGIVIAVLEVMD